MTAPRTDGGARPREATGPAGEAIASAPADGDVIEDLLINNRAAAEVFTNSGLGLAPARELAVVTCMDSRMDVFRILGLRNGEAHILRNAGGVITDDVIRSLCLSQRAMGTRRILLMHHTDCGLHDIAEYEFKALIEREVGVKPWWALESFKDPFDDVRQSIQRLYMSPFLAHKESIRGFVYDVDTSLLHEVRLSHR